MSLSKKMLAPAVLAAAAVAPQAQAATFDFYENGGPLVSSNSRPLRRVLRPFTTSSCSSRQRAAELRPPRAPAATARNCRPACNGLCRRRPSPNWPRT